MHVVSDPVPPPRPSFLVALALVIAVGAGCHVGSAEPADGTGTGGGGSPDAASAPTGDGSAAPEGDGGGGGAVTVPDDCVAFATEVPAKAHAAFYDYDQSAGNGCIGTCHVDGADQGETYTLAGSVFDTLGDGGNAIGGAHVFVKDAGGKVLDLVTSTSGEFFTAEALQFPVQTLATGCPGRSPMISMATGNCNGGAACHTATFKVNLPAP
ncbi:MAG TPA: hypothetical protein VKB80_10010 [Kofleriaceae bacterium]|nr:hypothetical protein [Kofleriaceae bacterium]